MIARSVAAARSLAGGPRTAPSPFPLALRRGDQPAIFGTDGGRTHAIVATVSRDVLEASPESRRRLAERFEDLLASLDAGLQILVQSRPTDFAAVADPALRRRLLRLPGPRLERRVSLVLTDTPAGIDRLRALLGRRGAAPPDEDGALAPPDAARLLAAAETLAAQLTAMGLAGEVLRGRALDRHLDAALPPIVARPGAAARWAEHPGHLDLDGEISRSYRLDAFPGAELDVGWLGALVDLPFPYDLAIHAELLPAPAVLRLLNRRIRDLEASHLGGATADPLVEAGLPDARGLRREVAANQRAALAVSVCLTVLAASPEEAAERGRMVEDAASRCLATMLPATFQMAAGRLATLPLGTDPLDRPHVLPADAAATLYPWTWEDLVQPAGHLLG
ncbi:MAG TPA: hypothetical protein VG245_00705, partial [Candidatus Dormibacteraeota bacterium]|nr:hypothetical protein [Candidatus Dormibacteraeota bacterium]